MRIIDADALLEAVESDITKPFDKIISRYDVISCPTINNVVVIPDNAAEQNEIYGYKTFCYMHELVDFLNSKKIAKKNIVSIIRESPGPLTLIYINNEDYSTG